MFVVNRGTTMMLCSSHFFLHGACSGQLFSLKHIGGGCVVCDLAEAHFSWSSLRVVQACGWFIDVTVSRLTFRNGVT